MEIVKMSSDTLKDMNKVSEPFEIIGKIKPTFVNDKWTYTEEIYDCSYLHSYPNEECDYSLYIENPDKLMHHQGIYSKVVRDEINNINRIIEELANSLDNTLIIVSADHSLITTKTINLKNDYQDIYDMLERTTSIELRTCGIKLKSDVKKEDFEFKFKQYFEDNFLLLSLADVRKTKLFGPNQNEYLYDNIGDYLAISTGNVSLIYDDNSPTFKANHAGLTNEELNVPLIIIECRK